MNKAVELLKTIDMIEWPEIWCQVNTWEVPEKLKQAYPKNWEERLYHIKGLITSKKDRYGFILPIMNHIDSKIPKLILLHHANVIKNKRMDSQRFQDWWIMVQIENRFEDYFNKYPSKP